MSALCRGLLNSFKFNHFSQGRANFSKLTFAGNGSTIVALHPEKKFPYELTRPLPEEPMVQNNTVLKMNNISEVMRVFKDVNPEAARENLMKLTLTTKHRWFPPGKRRHRRGDPVEKPYI